MHHEPIALGHRLVIREWVQVSLNCRHSFLSIKHDLICNYTKT